MGDLIEYQNSAGLMAIVGSLLGPVMTVVNRIIEGRANRYDSGSDRRINVFHEHSNRNLGSYVSDIPRIRMREETKEPLEDEVDPVEEIEKEIKERIHKKRRMLYGNNDSSNSSYGFNTGKNGKRILQAKVRKQEKVHEQAPGA